MSPAPKKPSRLMHIPVRLRVSVTPEQWGGGPRKAIEDEVRRRVAAHVREMPGVLDARRDRL